MNAPGHKESDGIWIYTQFWKQNLTFFDIYFYLFIWLLQDLVTECEIISCGMQNLFFFFSVAACELFSWCCCYCWVASVMSDSVQPHRQQPTRLLCPWDSPGKNTEVGCHFLLQCMKVKSESEVTQSCMTLRDPMDSSPPGSSVHRISQARVLESGATSF